MKDKEVLKMGGQQPPMQPLILSKDKLVWDIEANGLLEESTKIWCLCAKIIGYDKPIRFHGHELSEGIIEPLFSNKIIIGHNIINYDIPMIRKFYGLDLIDLVGKDNIIDTYLWSQVLYPDRPMPKGCPEVVKNPVTNRVQKIGPHGLESWGYRVGRKKVEIHDWLTYDPSIITRCEEDVAINEQVYYMLLKEAGINEL